MAAKTARRLGVASSSFLAGAFAALYIDRNVVPLLPPGAVTPQPPATKTLPPPPPPAPTAGAKVPATTVPSTEALKAAEKFRYGLESNEQIILRSSYAVAYDRRNRNPHWAYEHITPDSIKGEASRNNKFKEDDSISAMFRARLTDYVNSGYDRGHLVPAADMRKSQAAMDETFYLSNIAPQVGEGFNRAYWARFEQFVRDLTKTYSDVYVYTGVLYLPEKEPNGKHYVKYQVLGDPPNTAVPTHFYKVILAENPGRNRVMGAFLMRNDVIDEKVPLDKFVVPVEQIERGSGFTFFPNLDRRTAGKLCVSNVCTLPPPFSFKNNNNGKPSRAD